jgi:hypothetical protein
MRARSAVRRFPVEASLVAFPNLDGQAVIERERTPRRYAIGPKKMTDGIRADERGAG